MKEYGEISYDEILAHLSASLFNYSPIQNTHKDLMDEINKQVLKVNNLKQIKFANPEKLNTKFEYQGHSYEIVFVGRELALEEDNYSWVIYDKRDSKRAQAQLSVYKNPPSANSVKIHTTSRFGHKEDVFISKTDLNTPEWIQNRLIDLMDEALPF